MNINRIAEAKIIARDGREYEVNFPVSENQFGFFPAISEIIGKTTQGIIKLTVDSVDLPKDLFNQNMVNNIFTLKAIVLVGENELMAYGLETKIKVPDDAYVARNIETVDYDDLLIRIAPLQIEIPAYTEIKFKELSENE
jgi:hypothetical protein